MPADSMITSLTKDLQNLANPEKAKIYSNFFKTGKGQYGEGDIFLGISVPDQRKVAIEYSGLSLAETEKLLKSKIHEHRLVALLILVRKFKSSDENERRKIADFYLKNTKYVNNWDLVDLTADKILGDYLLEKDKSILYRLANSNNLWEKRISIISTFNFIRNNKFDDTFRIAEILMGDRHDLIHKACGWMLRETGKMNQKAEEKFLRKHYKNMPRTMLRYSIERFDDRRKRFYMRK